jgi:hypothetical protein
LAPGDDQRLLAGFLRLEPDGSIRCHLERGGGVPSVA